MSTQKLDMLIKERDILLEKHKDISFPTQQEIEKYIKDNQSELKRLKELNKEIRDTKWELMTEKERQEYLEEEKKIKEKYADD